jgi:hypothetical protein
MPPAASLPRRDAVALRAPRFPILAFDERERCLALGSVFSLEWLMPGESLVSILWKFRCANALSADFIVQQILPDIDPSVGAAPVRKLINLTRLRRLLRLPESALHISLLDASAPDHYHPVFRFCRLCAAHGYHSVLYQLTDEERCPVHRQSLETLCAHCGEETPYIVNTSMIEAPFRCVACHSHFSYGRLPLLSTTPVMRRRDRAAISRRLLLRSGDSMTAAGPHQSTTAVPEDQHGTRR